MAYVAAADAMPPSKRVILDFGWTLMQDTFHTEDGQGG